MKRIIGGCVALIAFGVIWLLAVIESAWQSIHWRRGVAVLPVRRIRS